MHLAPCTRPPSPLASSGGAEANLAHAVDDEAARVGSAAGEKVAHAGAEVLHEDPVGEAADSCGNAAKKEF